MKSLTLILSLFTLVAVGQVTDVAPTAKLDNRVRDLETTNLSAQVSKYTKIKNNVLSSKKLVEYTYQSLNTIKLVNTLNDFNSYTRQLNNPQSGVLGFTLDTIVMQSLRKNITSKIKSKGAGDVISNILNTTKSFLSGPLGSFINQIPYVAPAVTTVTNIVTFIKSIAGDKKINNDDIAAFEKEVVEYLKVYNDLYEADKTYTANNNLMKTKIVALQSDLNKYLQTADSILYKDYKFDANIDNNFTTFKSKIDAGIGKITAFDSDFNNKKIADFTTFFKENDFIISYNNQIADLVSISGQVTDLVNLNNAMTSDYVKNVTALLNNSTVIAAGTKTSITNSLKTKNDELSKNMVKAFNINEINKFSNYVKVVVY